MIVYASAWARLGYSAAAVAGVVLVMVLLAAVAEWFDRRGKVQDAIRIVAPIAYATLMVSGLILMAGVFFHSWICWMLTGRWGWAR